MCEAPVKFDQRVQRSQQPKIPFLCVIRNTVESYSYCCNTCQCWWGDLLLVDHSFFSSFLSRPLKMTAWPSLLLIFQLQSLFFLFLIFFSLHFIEFLFVFNPILESQFVIYCFFNLVLILLIYFLTFCWINISSQFHHSIKNLFAFFISIWSSLFIYFVFWLNWFFFLILPFNRRLNLFSISTLIIIHLIVIFKKIISYN